MARTKAVLGLGTRLSDHLSASLLARVYPAELVEQIPDEQGVNSVRVRRLPADVVAYYCMAMGLYAESAYEAVFSVVAQGWRGNAAAWRHPASPNPPSARRAPSFNCCLTRPAWDQSSTIWRAFAT